jgi:bifunctional non-homologous end joining protein LigD
VSGAMSLACRASPMSRPAGPAGFTKSSMGFRILAELSAGRVKLMTRKGFALAQRFPLAAAAIAALPARSCVVDGEAIACDANGLSVFDLLRYRRQDDTVTLCAFDLLELDSVDLRREPIEVRKRTLNGLLRREPKRLGSPYRPGRSDHWLKIKNPTAPAVRRLEEEDWQ